MSTIEQVIEAGKSVGLKIYGTDFLCRALAILHCYGGGPGGEYFRALLAHTVAMEAGAMLERAVANRHWPTIQKLRQYVAELQQDRAPWLERTLDRLNIPAREIRLAECHGLSRDFPCRLPGQSICMGGCRKREGKR